MIDYRAATPDDAGRILALRRLCFPDVDLEKQSALFREWEFERAPAGTAVTLIAIDGDRCVSHLAMIPRSIMVEGKPLRALLAVDAMTEPPARGKGIFTRVTETAAEMVRASFDLSFAYQNRSGVLGAMLRGGWQPAARWPVLIRPLSLRGMVSRRPGHDPLLRSRQHGVRLLTNSDVTLMSNCALRMTREDRLVLDRTPEWIAWRFFDNPGVPYRVSGVESSTGELLAWLVTRRTVLRGIDTLAIVDLAFTDQDAAGLLLDDALSVAREQAVAIAAAFASPSHRASRLLRRKLFLPSPYRFRHLINVFSPEGAAAANAAWPILWADTDHL